MFSNANASIPNVLEPMLKKEKKAKTTIKDIGHFVTAACD